MTVLNTDICILGAGPAGTAAAIAARRMGARVLLVERDGVPGGMGTAGMLNIWCGNASSSIFEHICNLTTKKFRAYAESTLRRFLKTPCLIC